MKFWDSPRFKFRRRWRRFDVRPFISIFIVILVAQAQVTPSPFFNLADGPQGQSVINFLRHITSISNQPSQFGRSRDMLLGRHVVPLTGIWTAVDPFTRAVHSRPNALDYLVADTDVATKGSVTLNAAFSCVDMGKSTVRPVQWTAATQIEALVNRDSTTGFLVNAGDEKEQTDTVIPCLLKRDEFKPSIDFKSNPEWGNKLTAYQVEHQDPHEGDPVKLVERKVVRDYVGDNTMFEHLRLFRASFNPVDTVRYDKKFNLPVVEGLPFDTSYRLYAPSDSRSFRVPLLPLSGITQNPKARLQHVGSYRGVHPTTPAEIWLNVLSNGLPLMLASYVLTRSYVSAYLRRADRLRFLPVRSAVNGVREPWDLVDTPLFLFSAFSALILAAPIALSAVEGKLDHRILFEVSTGVSVFYGQVQTGPTPAMNLSIDEDNYFAGVPFQVASWMTVTQVNDGFLLHLLGAILVVVLIIVWLTIFQTRAMSMVMPGNQGRGGGFSFWRLYGTLVLKYRLFYASPGNERTYQVFVRLRRSLFQMGRGHCPALAIASQETRSIEISHMDSEKREESNRARDALARELQHEIQQYFEAKGDLPDAKVELVARVKLRDCDRYEAMMAQTKPWSWRLPREWEYLVRPVLTLRADCRPMESYRVRGKRAPDEMLLLARLGLLKHLADVERVRITEDRAQRHYDDDECKVFVGLVESATPPAGARNDLPDGLTVERSYLNSGFDPDEPLPPTLRTRSGFEVDVVMLTEADVQSELQGPGAATSGIIPLVNPEQAYTLPRHA